MATDFNVTDLTMLKAFSDYSAYEDFMTNNPDLVPSTLAVVGDGTSSTTEVYYGTKKATDIIVLLGSRAPGVNDPNGKLYLRPVFTEGSSTIVTYYKMYYKTTDGLVIPITMGPDTIPDSNGDYILVLRRSGSSSHPTVSFTWATLE